MSGPDTPSLSLVLTPEALAFVADLHRTFNATREAHLQRRAERQAEFDAGAVPDFLEDTRTVREAAWTVAPTPDDLQKRWVEITGPVDRKMMINAFNSGANVFMADFEDALSPTWLNIVEGQKNLIDAVRRTLAFDGGGGKTYALRDEIATLLVRPRGWHLTEKHVEVDGAPISASLFDFGLFLFHNGRELLNRGSGPYFYLAKLESHLEARLWNDVFNRAQDRLGLPRGSIRATVLIETILAAFEMEEILYELRDHAAGLNAGRWDYIFSLIKKFRNRRDLILPDRAQVGMTVPFMRALHHAARADLPSTRGARDRRDGRVHPDPEGSGGQQGRAGEGPGGQGARVERWVRRDLDRSSRPCAGGCPGVRRCPRGTAPSEGENPRPPAGHGAGADHPKGLGRHHYPCRPPEQHQRRAAVSEHVAPRQRRGCHLQPDGRHGDRRDQSGPDMAMASTTVPRWIPARW